MKFLPQSLQFNLLAADTGKEAVGDSPARHELAVNKPLPAGWVLLRGVLHRRELTSSARLVAVLKDLEGQTLSFPIPVSRKGTVFELLHLPNGIVGLVLEPARGGE